MNAMEHGNEYRRDRPVTIRVLYAADALCVQVTDRGERSRCPSPKRPTSRRSSRASSGRAGGDCS